MSISSKQVIFYLVLANLVFVCLYSPFISEINALHVISALLTVTVLVVSLAVSFYRASLTHNEVVFIALVFFLLVLISLGSLQKVTANELVRAYLPFIYFPVFVLLCLRLDERKVQNVLKLLLLVGVGASMLVVPFFIELFLLNTLNYSRLTAYSGLIHTPILIITIPLIYMFLKKSKYLVLTLVLIALLATQSKGQILFGGLALVICELREGFFRIKTILKLGVLLILIAAVFIVFEETLARRFSDALGGTSMHRLEEAKIAYQYFINDPFFGHGPKTTFLMEDSAVSVGEQRYIHNVVMYVLATGGVLGLLIYLYPFFMVWGTGKLGMDMRYLAVGVSCAFLYLLVSATFKSIQTNLFLGVMIGSFIRITSLRSKEC